MTDQADTALLRLLQLCSGTLPIGGFTYSQGIEWAVECDWITDQASLTDWLTDLIDTSLAQVEIPVLVRLYRACEHDNAKVLAYWSDWLMASREARELRDKERNRGRALTSLLVDLDIPSAAEWRDTLAIHANSAFGAVRAAAEHLRKDGGSVVLVSSAAARLGLANHEAIAAAKGADVIVLDHHLAGADLPDCVAVVNPNRQDEDGELGHLCAASVVFLMLVEAGRHLNPEGLLVVEVGSAAPALLEQRPDLPFSWPGFERGGEGVFLLTAEQIEAYMEKNLVNIIGGCCGTTPAHIRAMVERLQAEGARPAARAPEWVPSLASAYQAINFAGPR